MQVTYFFKDIERIEGGEGMMPAPASPRLSDVSPEGLYVNDQLGIEMKVPRGWFLRKDPGGRPGIYFTKQTEGRLTLPLLGISLDRAPANAQTSLDAVNFFIQEYKSSAPKKNVIFTLVESAREVDMGGRKGARFIFTMLDQFGRGTKNLDCKVMRGNGVISIVGINSLDNFQNSQKDFEEAINSLKFLMPDNNFAELQKLNTAQLNFKPVEAAQWGGIKKTDHGKYGKGTLFPVVIHFKG